MVILWQSLKNIQRLCDKYSIVGKVVEIKQVKYLNLPFQGHISYCIRKEFFTLLHNDIPNVTFRFIFVNTNTIGSIFRYKDRLSDLLCSNIVYGFNCPSCKAGCVGSTSRNLKLRMCELKSISYRTSRHISNPSFAVIRNHSRETSRYHTKLELLPNKELLNKSI